MAEPSSLRELRTQELTILKQRVAKRIKIKALTKRVRRIVGVDVVFTPKASKIHVCACLISFPKLEVLEEAIATDEMDLGTFKNLGNVSLVPLVLSVLKMLKRNIDIVAVREIALGEEITLGSYVGVISGKPAFSLSERSGNLKKILKWEGERRAGLLKIKGRKSPIAVIAGHHISLKDATALAKACAKDFSMPEPICSASARVRAWEREWRRVNLPRR